MSIENRIGLVVVLGLGSVAAMSAASTLEERVEVFEAQPLETELAQEKNEYRIALERILESDQRYRTAISWGTTDPDELARLEALDDDAHMAEYIRRNREGIRLDPEVEKELWEKQNKIDRANTIELMELIEHYGWPTEETAGEDFPSPTPVLIHMPMEDIDKVLPVLKEEVLEGRMDPNPYAMIYDRKQQHDGQPQLYGKTQAYDASTQSVLPPAVVDIDQTNAARAEIGLAPLEEYRITDAHTAAGG